MQALVYTDIRRVEIQQQPVPEPAENETLVLVEAAGVCGSDVDGFLGRSRKRKPPLVMGHEFAGRLSEDVPERGLKTGALVTVMPLLGCGTCVFCQRGETNRCPDRKLVGMDRPGAFAQYVSVPRSNLYALPDGMPVACAVMAEPMANACHIVRLIGPKPPEAALVIGCGTIGMVVTGALRLAGCTHITVADTNAERLPIALQQGADFALDASQGNLEEQLKSLMPSIPLVIDCIGMAATRALGIALADPGGMLVWIGLHDGDLAGEGRDIVTKELTIHGSYGYTHADFAAALTLLSGGAKNIQNIVSFAPLADGQQVFDQLADSPGPTIKVALVP